MCENWAGERLGIELAVRKESKETRPVSMPGPFGPSVEVWRSCIFLGGMFRAERLPWRTREILSPVALVAIFCRLRLCLGTGWAWADIRPPRDG